MKHSFAFLVLFFSFISSTWSQKAENFKLASFVDSVANEALQTGPVAGLSIAIMQNDKLLFAKGYGYAHIEHNVPATAETIYGMRSIGKNFTAAATLLLVEQGKLSLDDNINKYLPDSLSKGQVITIRQLLSHTSGIHNVGGKRFHDNKTKNLSAAEWVELYKDDSLDFVPGTNYAYSNTGFYLLEMIIEKLTGKPLAEFVRKRITDSLNIHYAIPYSKIIKNSTSEYDLDKGVFTRPIPWINKASAMAGVSTTVINMVKYQQALNKLKIVNAASLADMRKSIRLYSGPAIDYGLGARIGELEGRQFFGHTGDGGGGTAVLAYYPKGNLIISVATNTEAYNRHASFIQAAVARKILSLKEKEVSLTKDELKKFEGVYKMKDVELKIYEENGKLIGKPEGVKALPDQLIYHGNDRFTVKEIPRQGLKFENINGIMWVQLYWDGFFHGVGKRE